MSLKKEKRMSVISFDSKVAAKYGISESVFIYHLQYMLNHHKAHNRNFYDGRYWNYNSMKYFTNHMYEFWTIDQIRRVIKSLVDKKVILVGNYNKNKYDRTAWYAFVNEKEFLTSEPLDFTHVGESPHPFGEDEVFVPESTEPTKPLNKPNNKNTCPSSLDFTHMVEIPNGCGENPTPIPVYNQYNNFMGREGSLRGENYIPPSPPSRGEEARPSGSASQPTLFSSFSASLAPLPKDFVDDKQELIEREREEIHASRQRVLKDAFETLPTSRLSRGKQKQVATYLPGDWVLPTEWREWSRTSLGMSDGRIDSEAEKFRIHWLSTAKNPTKRDWYSTWQGWCRRSLEYSPQQHQGASSVYRSSAETAVPSKPLEVKGAKRSDNPKIQQWYDLQPALRDRVGKDFYVSWLQNLEPVSFEAGAVRFKVANRFLADQVYNRFIDDIAAIVAKIDPDPRIEIYITAVV